MRFTTKVINIAGEGAKVHYTVKLEQQTLCGIRLSDKQTLLNYSLNDEKKLCEKCKEISPIPRIRDWSPRYKITGGEFAKRVLTDMLIFYQALPEEVQIGWGIWEYGNTGRNNLTNFLINPEATIEYVLEDEKVIVVSYRTGNNQRVNKPVTFDLIAEFMPIIKEDFLMEVLQKKYTN